jgi:hypothetical protein
MRNSERRKKRPMKACRLITPARILKVLAVYGALVTIAVTVLVAVSRVIFPAEHPPLPR